VTDFIDDQDWGKLSRTPERMQIMDLRTEQSLTVQFNPSELEETIKVEWARMAPPGFSHKRLHYVGTDNVEFSFELVVDAMIEGTTLEETLRTRQFLQSLCYAKRGAKNVLEGQAPRALFIWPNLITLTAVIDELAFKYERFHVSGAPTRYTVKVKLEEIRDVRLYGEDVLEGGSQRNADLPAPKGNK
jgi:hypothetical protein